MWFNNNKWLVKGFFLSFLLLQRWSRKWWNFYQYDLISTLSKDISTLENISTLISTDSTSTSTFSIARSAESHRLYLCPWHQNIKKWNAKAEKLLPLVTSHRFSNYERIIKQDFLYPLVRWANTSNTDTTDEKVTQLVLSSLSSFHNKNYACLSKFCILPPIISRAVYKVFFLIFLFEPLAFPTPFACRFLYTWSLATPPDWRACSLALNKNFLE